MDAMVVRLLESVARPIALAIANSIWQGAIIAGIVGATLSLLREKSASVRYVVACVGLLAILATTVATGVWYVRHPEPDVGSRVIWHRVLQGAVTGTDELADVEATPAGNLDSPGTASTGAPPPPSRLSFANIDMALAGPWVFFAWLVGVLLLGVLQLTGWRRAQALVRAGTSNVTSEWARRIGTLSERMGLPRAVRALVSKRVSVPTVVGWVRPVILVPAASFTELTAAQLELVLIHELAHIRRHDVLVNYLQATVETLLFYHPATWWLSRRVRIEREHCCDDAAVIATGDGPAFARALSEVENMRERAPMHAMAADGGAFRNRIRRLVGAPPSGAGSRGSAGLAGVLVVALVLGLFVPSLTAAPVSGAGVAADAPFPSDWNDVGGEWRAEGFGGQIRMHFDLSDWGECSLTFDDERFKESGTDARELTRSAGTFILEGGSFPRKWRPATFRPDAEYAAEMQRMGYDIEEPEHLLELAIHDVTLDFARGIAEAGYDLTRSALVGFHIHDVTPEYVKAMAAAGYDDLTPDRIVEFAIHDIEPEYVQRLAAIGYDELTHDRLIEFAIHDIEPEYVERLAAVNHEDLSPSRIIEFAIHDIEPEYIERVVAAGFDEVTMSRIIEFAIHGIEPDYIERMAAVGLEDMTPSRIIEFGIHDISPSYIESMVATGYEGLSPSRIIEFKIHGIQPSFVNGLMEVGYADLSPNRLVEFAIHDVTPGFIRDLEEQGITGLSPSELIERKIKGRHSHRGNSY